MSLLGSLGRHAGAVGALAGEEAREAAELYLRLGIFLGAALFFAAFGYILVLLCIAFIVAAVFNVSWLWILPVLAIVHLVVAFLCALHVKTHWRTPLFPATRGELARDWDSLQKKSAQ